MKIKSVKAWAVVSKRSLSRGRLTNGFGFYFVYTTRAEAQAFCDNTIRTVSSVTSQQWNQSGPSEAPMKDDPALDERTAEQLRRDLVARECTCPFPNPYTQPYVHAWWCRYRVAEEASPTPPTK